MKIIHSSKYRERQINRLIDIEMGMIDIEMIYRDGDDRKDKKKDEYMNE